MEYIFNEFCNFFNNRSIKFHLKFSDILLFKKENQLFINLRKTKLPLKILLILIKMKLEIT